jgi:mRNA-degrading endonuclease HigB of HigAB toxin-antitoxin module
MDKVEAESGLLWRAQICEQNLSDCESREHRLTLFNVKGNDYRLITVIRYQAQRVYTLYVLTHSEYDKEKWKDDCYC